MAARIIRSAFTGHFDGGSAPLGLGPLRVTGACLDEGCHVSTVLDRLDWLQVLLVEDRGGAPGLALRQRWRQILQRRADPGTAVQEVLLAMADAVGSARADIAGVGLLRVSPCGSLAEVINVGLPAVVHWHPDEGTSPYEPIGDAALARYRVLPSEVVQLEEGSALAMLSGGLLSRDAGWGQLATVLRGLGVDPFGGAIADMAPRDLADLLARDCPPADVAPIGVTLVGRAGPARVLA
jgi:hypothetical protein